MSQDKRDVANDMRLMPCQAGGRSYYLDASAIRAVHRKEEWRLNWRSESPLGWIRYQGGEIPILDLARALGVSHTHVSNNAVVVETGAGPRAWGVGGVGRVVALAGERILPLPAACLSEDSPPWAGLVTGEGTQALCVSAQHLGLPAESAAAARVELQTPASGGHSPSGLVGAPTGRALLFSAFDGKGRLPEVLFCLGFGQVAELVMTPRQVPIPSARPWLTGLIVWRERSVPIVNLSWAVQKKIALADAEDYLIVRATLDGAFAAVPVFGRPEAVVMPLACEQEAAPAVAYPQWFKAAFKRSHQLLLTPDFTAILAAEHR